MRNTRVQTRRLRLKQTAVIAASIQLMFGGSAAWANPTGAQVVSGTATMQSVGSTLTIKNSPGAIINWQGFSIGPNELTHFSQQSASSAVLNRVIGADISRIQGVLSSNGRVFLINPAGILIGAGARIDTAGFVGSTLNMLDSDFLAGKLKFQGDGSSGSIINYGSIRTEHGGRVILVAPQIENHGLIQTPGGELILAAGRKVTIASLDQEGVQFEIQAPTDSVLNVGQLIAAGGAVGVFAGSLRHSGEIRANALVRDEGGNIVLKAANEIQIAAGSITSASGKTGGNITIESAGHTRVAGQVAATGSEGKGGNIHVLGNKVTAADSALIDASGAAGGGNILLGGDFQGNNPAVRNATDTFVASSAILRADATQTGDGGRIIVWSDDKAQFYGSLSAQGGALGGNGGFAEVSGKKNLIFDGAANLGAPKGKLGNLLLDPLDLYVFSGGGTDSTNSTGVHTSTIIDEAADFPSNAVTISPATLAAINGNVTLFASRYMRIGDAINLTTPGQSLTALVGTYAPSALPDPIALDTTTPNRLDIAANITTTGGAVSLNAPLIQSTAASTITTNGGAISLASGTSISASQLSLVAGNAAVTATSAGSIPGASGSIQLNAVSGGSFSATSADSLRIFGNIATAGGPVSLTAGNTSSSFVDTVAISTGGGTVTIAAPTGSVSTGAISAGSGDVTFTGKSSVFGSPIDTTGNVTLVATQGNVSATINNAANVSASATNANGSASVGINSFTTLNATSISATTTNCSSVATCSGANISLNAKGDINVGTVVASAPATTSNASVFNNSRSRTVSINSNGGSIRAMSPSSQITATDVSLITTQGSGGGIGALATALNVDVERQFTFRPNGEFNVLLNGSGPVSFNTQIGVAPTGKSYSGNIASTGGALTLAATATDSVVTISNLAATGFNQRLYGLNPSVTLEAPNGALVVNSITVPEGDTRPNDPIGTVPRYLTASQTVLIRANSDLTVSNYNRLTTANTLPHSTTFISQNGNVTLGNIVAGKDLVQVFATASGKSASVGSLTTAGDVNVTADALVAIGSIDTTTGSGSTGSVLIGVNIANGQITAQTDSVATEITSGGFQVRLSGQKIGTAGFANPLDVAGSAVILNSDNAGGEIGYAGAPVVANTKALTINAAGIGVNGAKFNVSSGAIPLQTLTVSANPVAVGAGGLAQVRTEAGRPNDKTYALVSDGTNFSFNPGAVPATQFTGGSLNLTTTQGDLTLGNLNLGTGSLVVTAREGSILGGAALDAANVTLAAGVDNNVSTTAVAINTGNIGGVVRPGNLQITSGNTGFSTSRQGAVTTGDIEAGSANIAVAGGSIATGNIGKLARAGTVNLNSNSFSSSSGAITVGNAIVDQLNTQSIQNNITAGNLDATNGITAITTGVITLGTVNADSLTTGTCFLCTLPQVTTGAITGVSEMSLDSRGVTVNGSITGDPAGTGTLFIRGVSGPVNIVGGSVTAGDGSTIWIDAGDTGPFVFNTINAGPTGSVTITSSNGIQQVGGPGVTANQISLNSASSTSSINQVGGDGRLDLNGVTDLSINTAGVTALDANGSTLNNLSIVKSQAPGAAAFTLANLGSGQSVSFAAGVNPAELQVNSPASPMEFSLNYAGGNLNLVGSGVTTSGGGVSISLGAGGFDGSVGGINTGGAAGGGSVNISTTGAVTTGTINTTPAGTGTGGGISISSNGINVSGDLRTGPAGGFIGLTSSTGSITRSGGAQIVSDGGVSVTSFNGDIGTIATPLLITSPNVSLTANGTVATAGVGNAYANLTGTSALTMTVQNGFNVSSNTAFTDLSLTTNGLGDGTPGASRLNLAASGQIYAFDRPATDLFGNNIAGTTFQVVSVGGASPLTNATFGVSQGDLLIGGPSGITAANLSLVTPNFGSSDIKLQGTAASPLMLSNSSQNIASGRDLLITGNVTINSGSTQNISALRNLTAQAQQGSINISAPNQTISSSTGVLSFRGGAAADERVTVSASGSQAISTSQTNLARHIELLAGAGDRSSVAITYSGSGEQTVQAAGNLVLQGGGTGSTDSTASITTATGSQLIRADGDINLLGGAGTNANARIVNTSGNAQQVGESRSSGFTSFPYQTNNINVNGGAGANSFAEITANGQQQVYVANGTIGLQGGSGANSFARIDSNSTLAEQRIGCPTSLGGCAAAAGTLNILGGTGVGSYARITTPGVQRVTVNSATTLAGNATDASATLFGNNGQIIRSGNLTLTAGAGNNANALVQSNDAQSIQPGNVTLTGGGAAGATATAQILAGRQQSFSSANNISITGGVGDNSVARIASGSIQGINSSGITMTGGTGAGSSAEILSSVSQSITTGNMTLSAGVSTGPIAGSSAIIRSDSQTITMGNLTLNAGAGTGAGTTSDALIQNLSGDQTMTLGVINLNGGSQFSTAGILSQGTGTQNITSSGIALTSASSAAANTAVLIQNGSSGKQTLSAGGSGIRLNNRGAGTVAITTGGDQQVTSQFVDVITSAGSTGDATLAAAGNQWIRTLNGTASPTGSMRVAALGSGIASIEAGASQLLQLDYPEQMQAVRDGRLTIGDVAAAGTSRIRATDQTVFARSIVIQTGGNNTLSELKASNNQIITTLNGGIDVLGGSGSDSLAQIDPINQIILSNGVINVIAGSGSNALAQIVSSGPQTIWTTNGNINVTGGTAAGAAAAILAGGLQNLNAAGDIVLTQGSFPGATATISGGLAPTVLASTPGSTSSVLALQETQYDVLEGTEPSDNEEDPVRRAPICF